MITRLLSTLLGILLSTGCGVTEFGNPGNSGGEEDCTITSSRAIDWTEAGSFGVSPESAFSAVEGGCQAPFHWDGSGWFDALTVEPVSGDGSIEVTISVDRQSAVLVERETKKGSGGLARCPSYLEVLAQVTLKTADGSLDEQRQVTISYRDNSKYGSPASPLTVWWLEDPDELEGTLSIQTSKKNTSLGLSIEIMPIQTDCAGRISLSANTADGEEGSGVAQINFATWSMSGCEFGRLGIELDEPYQGLLLGDEIANRWTEATYEGRWDDGEVTIFHLNVTPSAPIACLETHDRWSVVVVPVRGTYETEDGRINDVSGSGNVRATVQNDQRLSQLDLWVSEDMECDPFFDLSYRSMDCSQVHHLTAQLGINHYFDSSGISGGRVELYVFKLADDGVNPRNSSQSDLVPTIVLTPL